MFGPTIERLGNTLKVTAPFHPKLPGFARVLRGVWDPHVKAWAFQADDEAMVRKMLLAIFGTDGTTTLTPPEQDTVEAELYAQVTPAPAMTFYPRQEGIEGRIDFTGEITGIELPPAVIDALRARGVGPDTIFKSRSEAHRVLKEAGWISKTGKRVARVGGRTPFVSIKKYGPR